MLAYKEVVCVMLGSFLGCSDIVSCEVTIIMILFFSVFMNYGDQICFKT
jgi:hypothetical protein